MYEPRSPDSSGASRASVGTVASAAVLVLALAGPAIAGLYGMPMATNGGFASAVMFLLMWEVMVVAMMLPASAGFFLLFNRAVGSAPGAMSRRLLVVLAYLAPWCFAGGVVLAANEAVWRSGADAVLRAHPSLLAAGTLALVGGYQLTGLKQRCLLLCTNPARFILRHYRRGASGAARLGFRFGLTCLGCCWALMVLMVVVGAGSMTVVLLLAAVMFSERSLGWSRRFPQLIGASAIATGVLIALAPWLLPTVTASAARWVASPSIATAGHGWMFWCGG